MCRRARKQRILCLVRYLWIISAAMVATGGLLILGSLVVGAGPLVLLSGVLLLWSGAVKVIVLHIWRRVLAPPPAGRDVAPTTPPTAGTWP
jgi:hypothetical protein